MQPPERDTLPATQTPQAVYASELMLVQSRHVATSSSELDQRVQKSLALVKTTARGVESTLRGEIASLKKSAERRRGVQGAWGSGTKAMLRCTIRTTAMCTLIQKVLRMRLR